MNSPNNEINNRVPEEVPNYISASQKESPNNSFTEFSHIVPAILNQELETPPKYSSALPAGDLIEKTCSSTLASRYPVHWYPSSNIGMLFGFGDLGMEENPDEVINSDEAFDDLPVIGDEENKLVVGALDAQHQWVDVKPAATELDNLCNNTGEAVADNQANAIGQGQNESVLESDAIDVKSSSETWDEHEERDDVDSDTSGDNPVRVDAKFEISPGKQRRICTEPTEKDVLLGRGEQVNHHKGNIRFRELRENLKDSYRKLSKRKRITVAIQMARSVHEWGGSFIKKDKNVSWTEVEDLEAIRKCQHALREKKTLSKKRKRLLPDDCAHAEAPGSDDNQKPPPSSATENNDWPEMHSV
ncbi:hypothetical protein ACA910_021714 [Epithemia clementina (nom. ined.)]